MHTRRLDDLTAHPRENSARSFDDPTTAHHRLLPRQLLARIDAGEPDAAKESLAHGVQSTEAWLRYTPEFRGGLPPLNDDGRCGLPLGNPQKETIN